VSAYIYIEGGAKGEDSKIQKIRCQEAFHKLLDAMGFKGRKPRLVACGGRQAVYDRFLIERSSNTGSYVAMWIDSEEPIANIERTWDHLESVATVQKWARPENAEDDQVLFMTTCMETWIVADRAAVRELYGNQLQESALPPVVDLENRGRHEVQDKLCHATRACTNPYQKGAKSFAIFARLNPATLERHLPSFARIHRILNSKL
jgi:hypothetical protein